MTSSVFSARQGLANTSTSFFVCELVDAHLATPDDTTSVFFELRWGSFTARSSTKKAVRGIVTMTERIRIQVPSLAQRRIPMELHMLSQSELAGPSVIQPLGWMPVPAHDVMAGKKVRHTFPLRAPDTEMGATMLRLNAAFFLEDTLMTGAAAPADVPYTDFALHDRQVAVAANAREREQAAAAKQLLDSILRDGNSSLTSEQAAVLVASLAAGGLSDTATVMSDKRSDVGSVASFASVASRRQQGGGAAGARAAVATRPVVPTSEIACQTDLTGPVVSESVLTHSRQPQVPKLMDDMEEVERIRAGFDFPAWSKEEKDRELDANSKLNVRPDASTRLRKPVDLLVMKNTVAAWPRDEVEGLIAYGEQMKRYATELEQQNAQLVLRTMRNATAELVEMPKSVDLALSRSASRMMAHNPLTMGGGGAGSSPPGGRSVSSIMSPGGSRGPSVAHHHPNPHHQQPQEHQYVSSPSRTGSVTAPPPFSGDGGARSGSGSDVSFSPHLQRIMRGGSSEAPSTGGIPFTVDNFEEIGKPQFLTKMEMSRGEPLGDSDKMHVMRHMQDL